MLSSSGFSINAHYCKGELKSLSLIFLHNSCSCGKNKMAKDCCKNKTEFVKIKDNFISTSIVITPSMELVYVPFAFIQTFNLSNTENGTVESNLNYLYLPDKPISLSILYRSIQI